MKWIVKILDIKPYSIKTLWNDGVERTVHLEEFIKNNSANPNSSYSKLLDKQIFCKAQCDGTTLCWENMITYTDLDGSQKLGALDIAPELLFELSFEEENVLYD